MRKHLYPLIILIISAFIYGASVENSEYKAYTFINGKKVNLFVADTPELRQKGLMHRDKLDENSGMVFIFEKKEPVAFWMKNVKFPLDLVFISNNKIVKINKNVPICTSENCPIYPCYIPVDTVIEFNAGFCEKHNIQPGQYITIKRKN